MVLTDQTFNRYRTKNSHDGCYIIGYENYTYYSKYDSGTASSDICRKTQSYDYFKTGIPEYHITNIETTKDDIYSKLELRLLALEKKRIIEINNKKLSKYYSKQHLLNTDYYQNAKYLCNYNRLRQPPQYKKIADKIKKLNKNRKKYEYLS